METTASFSCQVSPTDPAAQLGLEVWLDDLLIVNVDHVQSTVDCYCDIEDTPGEHELRFVLKNKTFDHTVIDAEGNIEKDARLIISNVAFENIDLGHIFIDKTRYNHNFNGTADPVVDHFYGEMGCNGTVSLQFTTPIYLWLLENM